MAAIGLEGRMGEWKWCDTELYICMPQGFWFLAMTLIKSRVVFHARDYIS